MNVKQLIEKYENEEISLSDPGGRYWKKKILSDLRTLETERKQEGKEIWDKACKTLLNDISKTFLSKSNKDKAYKSSDKDVFQAVGETILNFPIPDFANESPLPC